MRLWGFGHYYNQLTRQRPYTMTRIIRQNMSTSKEPIDLLSGWPNPSLLPPHQLSTAAQTILADSELSKSSLKYAPDAGYQPLREVLATWLNSFYKPNTATTVDRICITGGASQNLACILQTFTDPIYTRNIWMVAPTYFLACRIFDDSGFAGRMKGIPEDEDGIDIDFLADQIAKSERHALDQGNTEPKLKSRYAWRKTYKHIIYAVPTFANPSGRVMSLRRREQLVRLARAYDALIITDDVYDMLAWSSTRHPRAWTAVQPRLVDIDSSLDNGPTTPWGNTLSNGSFSKIIAPGCRTGWAEAQPQLAWALSQCGSSRSGGAPSQLVASIIHQMIATGALDAHLQNTLLPAYADRYCCMTRAIAQHLLPLGVTTPETTANTAVAGGYFIFLTLPAPLLAEDIRKQALAQENLTVISGPRFRVAGDESENGNEMSFDRELRLCFSFEEYGKLEEGVLRLARVIKSKLER